MLLSSHFYTFFPAQGILLEFRKPVRIGKREVGRRPSPLGYLPTPRSTTRRTTLVRSRTREPSVPSLRLFVQDVLTGGLRLAYRPVVLSGNHAHVRETLSARAEGGDSDEGTERVVQVMKWGLVPSWHKGDPRSFPTLLNNCRYDGMLEKPSFRTAVSRRQRCVVLADGSVNCMYGSIAFHVNK